MKRAIAVSTTELHAKYMEGPASLFLTLFLSLTNKNGQGTNPLCDFNCFRYLLSIWKGLNTSICSSFSLAPEWDNSRNIKQNKGKCGSPYGEEFAIIYNIMESANNIIFCTSALESLVLDHEITANIIYEFNESTISRMILHVAISCASS